MTDQEVICNWMEPRSNGLFDPGTVSLGGWWWANTQQQFEPFDVDSLDRLREVEARLSDEQWEVYLSHLWDISDGLRQSDYDAGRSQLSHFFSRFLAHASAEQKIAALAAALRDCK